MRTDAMYLVDALSGLRQLGMMGENRRRIKRGKRNSDRIYHSGVARR